MAGKILDYELVYFEKGKENREVINITFVCNLARRELRKALREAQGMQDFWHKIGDLNTEIAAIQTERPDNWREIVSDKNSQINELSDKVVDFYNEDLLKTRFELIKMLLEDNGHEGTKYTTYEFWDRQVDPAICLDFLLRCLLKDVDTDDKKKVVQQ